MEKVQRDQSRFVPRPPAPGEDALTVAQATGEEPADEMGFMEPAAGGTAQWDARRERDRAIAFSLVGVEHKHVVIIYYYLLMPTNTLKQASRDLGVSTTWLQAFKNSDFFQEKLAELREKIHAPALMTLRECSRSAADLIMQRIIAALSDESEEVPLEKAVALFEKLVDAIGKLDGRQSTDGKGLSINLYNQQAVAAPDVGRALQIKKAAIAGEAA